MTDRQRHGFVLLLVFGLIITSLVVITQKKTRLGLDLKGGVELVYQAEPSKYSKVTPAAMARAVDIMRQRVDQLGVSEPEIQTEGSNQISVGLPDVKNTQRAINQVGSTAQLVFYDWESNLLVPPSGKTAASLLPAQDPTAVTLSQGSGSAPGEPGNGGQPLYQAVLFASKQPSNPGPANARGFPEYFLFGAPGSAACAQAAKAAGKTPVPGVHCLLSGPAENQQDLVASLPNGVTASEGQALIVPQGIAVLQAANRTSKQKIAYNSPSAEFYVLRDNVALRGTNITNPRQGTDQSGAPDVQFGFTSSGQKAFQRVTAQIAHRGDLVSGLGHTFNQHFAVALDNQLVTVPQIDFKTYPDGIPGDSGADITGGFSVTSAQDLANELRLGALPIRLRLISESTVSATLGKQALHQGLVAGGVGLAIVALFLIFYYRILGVIATSALVVYAFYFYALIKLIPITMTLPGIAGLILTIGVAADANIVIFERVKEEIRGGRSVRAGIATGYRKGLTAIIDANVVTIMTAFILFVLATAQVQGFAFTLGIGTFVSLFTAVLATQAILMTGAERNWMRGPSALGAARKKREWRFDFMGASRYFFSMSGMILLIGALAVGGRGLHLGIDFTSGTRISVGLQQPATAAAVKSIVEQDGGGSGTIVQRINGNHTLGKYAFQISSKKLGTLGPAQVHNQLQARYGVTNFQDQSVGPTFGHTVANNAVVAIIASLLVISVYIALRFEWKFAVPVLIALMHDLLITSGVYALTGREVTVDTVAALLTILGYSLYDTIIVFDRVRENIPRMPRAAFSQIVNRSMSEVLTRSLATTSCTLLPIIALLIFGGSTLQDFAFALMIGVASGAYSSIFIASPVLTHWKEREHGYRSRRSRLIAEFGAVPAYAIKTADIEPKRRIRSQRLGVATPDNVSAAEFEEMKRDLERDLAEEAAAGRQTSTLTRRLAHSPEDDAPAAPSRPQRQKPAGKGAARPASGKRRSASARRARPEPPPAGRPEPPPAGRPEPEVPPGLEPELEPELEFETDGPPSGDDEHISAPDVAENEGMMPDSQKGPRRPKNRNRRHGRRR
jgi:SecD/SecF fusion protein